jgi:cytochrome c2
MMSPIAQKFDVKELPTKFLISPKGQIIGTNMSFEEMGKQLTAKFQ